MDMGHTHSTWTPDTQNIRHTDAEHADTWTWDMWTQDSQASIIDGLLCPPSPPTSAPSCLGCGLSPSEEGTHRGRWGLQLGMGLWAWVLAKGGARLAWWGSL